MTVPGNVNELLLRTAAGAAGGYSIERSLRFNSADSAYLSRTPASAGNRKTWTWSGWIKRAQVTNAQNLFGSTSDGYNVNYSLLYFPGTQLRFEDYSASSLRCQIRTTQVFRDPSAWFHVVLAVDTTQATSTNRVKVYVNGTEVTDLSQTTYPSQNTDLFINSTNGHHISYSSSGVDGYLADIYFIDGSALTPSSFGETDATTGVWVPKAPTGLTYGTNGFHLDFADNSSAAALGYDAAGSNDWTVNNLSVWNGGTKMYSVAAFSNSLGYGFTTPGYLPAQSFDGSLTTFAGNNNGGGTNTWTAQSTITVTSSLRVYVATGAFPSGTTWSVNGVSQGSTSNGWLTATGISTPYTLSTVSNTLGSTATGAFFAAIEVDGSILVDITNPGNDSLRDSPTNGTASTGGDAGGVTVGNYCTINPLGVSANTPTISDGNLQMTLGSQQAARLGTIGVTSGKWYWEIVYTAATAFDGMVGVARQAHNLSNYVGSSSDSWGYYYNGVKYNAGSATSYGSSWTTGDVIGVALDMDNLALYFSKNGTWQNSGVPTSGASKTGAAYTNLSGEIFPALNAYGGTQVANFGQRAFAYAAPSGYKALCTANLPAPTIVKPSTVMDVVLYTGTGSALTPTSTLGFNPDLVWIKGRSGATDHAWYDAVRGVEKRLESNTTDVEVTSDGGVTAFNSAGFSVGTLAQVNTNSVTYAGWCWDAGTSNATNTSGTITSTVRANISAGFSIVTYQGNATSGATFGHGLGVTPHMVIIKSRSAPAASWIVWHRSASTANDHYLVLNTTAAVNTNSVLFQNVGSSVVTIGSADNVNTTVSPGNVAYCWAPVAGYSAFGSYTGNGSSDGPFVATSMRPRWIMLKRTDTTSNWTIIDTAREGYNVDNDPLYPNLSDAEGTTDLADILSNGFKLRSTDASVNASSGTYVYVCFAESPFQYARAR